MSFCSYNWVTSTEFVIFNRERDTAIASLILGSGLRLSEVVGANIEDVDLTENLLRVIRKGGKEQYVYFSDLHYMTSKNI